MIVDLWWRTTQWLTCCETPDGSHWQSEFVINHCRLHDSSILSAQTSCAFEPSNIVRLHCLLLQNQQDNMANGCKWYWESLVTIAIPNHQTSWSGSVRLRPAPLFVPENKPLSTIKMRDHQSSAIKICRRSIMIFNHQKPTTMNRRDSFSLVSTINFS